jgi:5-methylcytosine-specific restriction endonuclease McrA
VKGVGVYSKREIAMSVRKVGEYRYLPMGSKVILGGKSWKVERESRDYRTVITILTLVEEGTGSRNRKVIFSSSGKKYGGLYTVTVYASEADAAKQVYDYVWGKEKKDEEREKETLAKASRAREKRSLLEEQRLAKAQEREKEREKKEKERKKREKERKERERARERRRKERERERLAKAKAKDKEKQKKQKLLEKKRLARLSAAKEARRRVVPLAVRDAVWRRDRGMCAQCGSRKGLEFDHIVPVSLGGSNTARNIELLCEKCNRSKGKKIDG